MVSQYIYSSAARLLYSSNLNISSSPSRNIISCIEMSEVFISEILHHIYKHILHSNKRSVMAKRLQRAYLTDGAYTVVYLRHQLSELWFLHFNNGQFSCVTQPVNNNNTQCITKRFSGWQQYKGNNSYKACKTICDGDQDF